MKIEFLGTGAADWNIEKRKEGEFWRRFSSALVNDELLIDPGPHIFDYAEKMGKPDMFCKVKAMILTHSHGDHLNVATACKIHELTGATLYGYKTADYAFRQKGIESFFCPIEPDVEHEIAGYTVIPYYSNHLTGNPEGEMTYNYIVKQGEKSFFYGCDSGWIMTRAWEGMKHYDVDTVIFELTDGDMLDVERHFSHTSIPMLEIMLYSFTNHPTKFKKTKYYATHLARTLHTSHEDTVKRLLPLGVTPMADGDVIEV